MTHALKSLFFSSHVILSLKDLEFSFAIFTSFLLQAKASHVRFIVRKAPRVHCGKVVHNFIFIFLPGP